MAATSISKVLSRNILVRGYGLGCYQLSERNKSHFSFYTNTQTVLQKENQLPTYGFRNNRFLHISTPKLTSETPQNTVQTLLQYWTGLFERNNITEPNQSAEYMIAHILNELTLFKVDKNQVLNERQIKEITYLCKRRLETRQPVQYVIGEWDFCDLMFKMEPPVFIPRPETEELVGHVSEDCVSNNAQRILDIGCGSGALILSILKKCPWMTGVAIDKSKQACDLTEHNTKKNELDGHLEILHMELKDDIGVESSETFAEKFDVIVSNPPYIPTPAMKDLAPEIANYEDHDALDGGMDGMNVVKQILQFAPKVLTPGGALWLEVDCTHPPMVKKYVEQSSHLNMKFVKELSDTFGKPRFCHLQYVPQE